MSWAGEVISSKDKSTVTDEFRELETDIDIRKAGLLKLQFASDAYHHSLSKRKDYSDIDEGSEKLLPVDALGIVMLKHGQEFGEDSAYGEFPPGHLQKNIAGQAHSKVATLQEAYALTFQDTFLSSLKGFSEEIKDYEHQRKKLESRRLSYDAAISKLEKVKSAKKEKEKDRKEAEDELQTARLRYEETSEDVRARALVIQENDVRQLRELTSFLDVEINFVQQYLEVLQDIKADWCDISALPQPESKNGPVLIHTRPAEDLAKPDLPKRRKSVRSNRSSAAQSSESSGDESTGTASRKDKKRRASTSASASRAPSRPTSRAERKRSDSTATAGGTSEKEKTTIGKKQGMAGWASSAVSSVTNRGKKSTEQFAALTDGEDSDADGAVRPNLKRQSSSGATSSFSLKRHSKTKSKESVAAASPKVSARSLRAPSRQESSKVVRALYDFTGSPDELTFKAGDEITVVNEVIDGWWMGELGNQRGLFPTTYTEPFTPSPNKPTISSRPAAIDIQATTGHVLTPENTGYVTSDIEYDHPFGDHLLSSRSPMYGAFDADSVTDSAAEDEEEKRLMPARRADDDDDSDFPATTNVSWPGKDSFATRPSLPEINTSPAKRAPPPPPPRRITSTGSSLAPPPLPQRRPASGHSQSSGSLSSLGHDASPFDSASELAMAGWPKAQAEAPSVW
ncbi:hypothetical protein HWV62_8122 [Athelia sp. TMB]|nr:hypothetical protein HWV62_8122 [Athelia sp. TMB]